MVRRIIRRTIKKPVRRMVRKPVRRTTRTKILMDVVAMKDFKQSFTNIDFRRAGRIAKKVNGRITQVNEASGTDSDILIVSKGLPQRDVDSFGEEFGISLMSPIRAKNKIEFKKKIKRRVRR